MKNIALRHDIGQRVKQEDTFLNYQAEGITNEEQAKSFLDEFHQGALNATKNYENVGSCGVSTVYLPKTKQVVWANLGDSQATLFIWKAVSQSIESRVLNTLDKAYPRILNEKRSQTLSVGKAYGDASFEVNGLTHDHSKGTLNLDELGLQGGDRVFLMTSCDGYFEWDDALEDYETQITALLRRNSNATIEEVMNSCFAQAKQYSEDNLTGFLIELTDAAHKAHNAIVFQVFDGHGGWSVSKAIVKKALKNILNDGSKFFDVHSSEDITLGYLRYEVAKFAALSLSSFMASMLLNKTQSNIINFIGSMVTPILCVYHLGNNVDKHIPSFNNIRGFFTNLDPTGHVLGKVPGLPQITMWIDQSEYFNLKVFPRKYPALAMAGFYLCNRYATTYLSTSSGLLGEAIISTAMFSLASIISMATDKADLDLSR